MDNFDIAQSCCCKKHARINRPFNLAKSIKRHRKRQGIDREPGRSIPLNTKYFTAREAALASYLLLISEQRLQ